MNREERDKGGRQKMKKKGQRSQRKNKKGNMLRDEKRIINTNKNKEKRKNEKKRQERKKKKRKIRIGEQRLEKMSMNGDSK